MRAVLNALEEVKRNGFLWLHVILNIQEVMIALKGNYDRSINSIISYIKAFASWFYFVDFAIIPGH